MSDQPVALITGAAQRVGAEMAKFLHAQGYRIAIHYRYSQDAAQALLEEFNRLRPNSALILPADCHDVKALQELPSQVQMAFGRLDLLINNASAFYPSEIGATTEEIWDDLLASNLRGPFFLCQAAYPFLKEQRGLIVNITDVQVNRPFKRYSVYLIAKAGLKMLTESLALELAPEVRVNAIAPGWVLANPELDVATLRTDAERLAKIPLQRIGTPDEVNKALSYLLDNIYVTGQTLIVDGGRSLC